MWLQSGSSALQKLSGTQNNAKTKWDTLKEGSHSISGKRGS